MSTRWGLAMTVAQLMVCTGPSLQRMVERRGFPIRRNRCDVSRVMEHRSGVCHSGSGDSDARGGAALVSLSDKRTHTYLVISSLLGPLVVRPLHPC